MTANHLRVYIAGPMRTGDGWMANIAAAIKAAQTVYEAGHLPLVPHTHTLLWDLMYPKSRDEWVTIDHRWLDACDALVRIEGESVGADSEVQYAMENAIPVYYGVREFLHEADRGDLDAR